MTSLFENKFWSSVNFLTNFHLFIYLEIHKSLKHFNFYKEDLYHTITHDILHSGPIGIDFPFYPLLHFCLWGSVLVRPRRFNSRKYDFHSLLRSSLHCICSLVAPSISHICVPLLVLFFTSVKPINNWKEIVYNNIIAVNLFFSFY